MSMLLSGSKSKDRSSEGFFILEFQIAYRYLIFAARHNWSVLRCELSRPKLGVRWYSQFLVLLSSISKFSGADSSESIIEKYCSREGGGFSVLKTGLYFFPLAGSFLLNSIISSSPSSSSPTASISVRYCSPKFMRHRVENSLSSSRVLSWLSQFEIVSLGWASILLSNAAVVFFVNWLSIFSPHCCASFLGGFHYLGLSR